MTVQVVCKQNPMKALQFTKENFDKMRVFLGDQGEVNRATQSGEHIHAWVVEEGGQTFLQNGDWVVRRGDGRFMTYRPERFDRAFDIVDN